MALENRVARLYNLEDLDLPVCLSVCLLRISL